LIAVDNDPLLNVNVELTNDAVTAVVEYEAVTANDDVEANEDDIEYDADTAFNAYEAVVAVPVNVPIKLPVILTEPDKLKFSTAFPVKTSYKSETKLAEISPPAVICALLSDNTPMISFYI
jgi:hypothetical protein